MMATCKGCGADIVWLETEAGKPMPCDPGDVTVFHSQAAIIPPGLESTTVLTPDGKIVAGYTQEPPGPWTSTVGKIPHWTTCTKRERFRK